jgi:nitrogen regulatory protein P-II 1
MYMILFVLSKMEMSSDLLDAWEAEGVSGITILPSTGLGRIRQYAGLRDDTSIIPSLNNLLNHEQSLSQTLFSIVPDDDMVDKVVQATQKVVGDLNEADRGILVVIPLARVYGLR